MNDVNDTGPATKLRVHHLNQVELSRRWSLSPRTLERWRWLKTGPAYLRAGGRILYRLEDIEAFERANLHLTSDSRRAS